MGKSWHQVSGWRGEGGEKESGVNIPEQPETAPPRAPETIVPLASNLHLGGRGGVWGVQTFSVSRGGKFIVKYIDFF
jgi:hypothetical protein